MTAVQKEPERLFVKEMSFKSGVKGRGSVDGESEGGDCDEVMCVHAYNVWAMPHCSDPFIMLCDVSWTVQPSSE